MTNNNNNNNNNNKNNENILRRGRLGNSVKLDIMNYMTSLEFDKEIFESDILCDIAHTKMLINKNIIPKEEGEKIIIELRKIYDNGIDSLNLDPSLDDIHMVIESELIKILGEDIAGKMHTGRSRNDEVATDLKMALRDKLLKILKLLIKLENTLLKLAENHKETLTIGYTHLQHAQPTTFAHHLLSYVSVVERDILRLLDTYKRINLCPLGSGAFATTGFNIDRYKTMELLGFDGLIENSIDGVASRDFILETMSNLAILGTNLSKLCEETVLFSSYEFSTIELSNEYTSTSSIMPQKKNPDVSEIARAKLSKLNGNLVTVLTILKALPNTYNRDLQEVSPHLWNSVNTTIETLTIIEGMVNTMNVNKERMEELAGMNYSTATELADTLVRECNISFRTAHGIVGEIVKEATELCKNNNNNNNNENIINIIINILEKNDLKLDKSKIEQSLNPIENVKKRTVIGGPAPIEVERAIKSYKNRINNYENTINSNIEKINNIKKKLLNK